MADPTPLILKMSADISQMQKQISAAVGIVDTGSAKMVLRSKEAAAAIEKSFGTINASSFGEMLEKTAKLQDQLSAAQAAGNAEEAKALRAELALRAQVQKAAVAQLETQLAIAKAAGNKGQIAQLTESLALQSQLSKFQGVGLTGAKALHEAEAAVVALGAAEKAAEGVNVGKALDRVFDRSRLAVLEEGSAKVPIFGSAIEALGPAGLAAAGGLAAVGIAAEEARKAMEWADDLDRTAKKLGVTTDSLQELDYASVATSVGLQQGREAMASFNEAIGKFESHVGDKKLEKWAEPLKLTRDEVNKTIDPLEKLQLVLERISKLPDAQERAAAAKSFGLDGLLPLINEGSEGIDKFIGKMKEARAAGYIVSPDQIAKAADLNDKVEEFAYRIGVDFKQIFIELAPAIEKVAEFLERCAHALADFTHNINPAALHELQLVGGFLGASAKGGALGGLEYLRDHAKEISDANVMAAQTAGVDWSKFVSPTRGTTIDSRQGEGVVLGHDTPKPDQTRELNKAAQDAYDSGLKALTSAQAALLTSVQARAAMEQAAVDDDLTKKLHDLDAEEVKIREAAKKGEDHNAAKQLALIESAKTEELNAAAAKKELIARNATVELLQQQAVNVRAEADYRANELNTQAQHLSALAALAVTTEARNSFERQALAASQERERILADAQLDEALARADVAVATGKTAEIITAQNAVVAALQAREALPQQQADARAAQGRAQENPVQKFQREVQNFANTAQEAGVTAMKDLSSGLADAIVNAKSLGQVAGNVFRQLLAQLLSAAIQKDIAAPLMHVIPGFASGTNFAPGGLALVGEQGPELVNLPRGASVTPSNQTLSALKNMSLPISSGPTIVQQSISFDLRGGVTTEDLLRQMNAMTVAAKNQAVADSLRLGKQQLPDAVRQHQLLRG